MKIATLKLFLVSTFVLLPAFAQANIGKVLFIAGPVSVERTASTALERGDTLLQGDINGTLTSLQGASALRLLPNNPLPP